MDQPEGRPAAWVHGDQLGTWVCGRSLEPVFTGVGMVIEYVVMCLGPGFLCMDPNPVPTWTK